MGQIYVDVAAAQAEQGIALMASGGTPAGIWLNWTAGGYTGTSWYWGETPVTSWWDNNYSTYGYPESNEETFKTFMSSEHAPENLNEVLGSWGNIPKLEFIYAHNLIEAQCVSE